MRNDWRVPLTEGCILNNKYIVRKCVASGGSCLLYDCMYTDSQGNIVDVYIKELFPQNPKNAITRSIEDGKSLNWNIQYLTKKAYQLLKFKNACKHLNTFYKDKNLCMNTSYQQDSFDENGTSYNVVAKSFAGVSGNDYENVKTIKDILQLVLKLTYVIKEYHQKGFLHLDIKPQNYLVAEDAAHEKIIQLYDLDSIVRIDQSGHIQPDNNTTITYTTGFCAPEIEMLEYGFTKEALSQIGTWTDIYSIGMILLKLICNQAPVSFYDSDNDVSFYLNSNLYLESPVFKNEFGESINPAVQIKVKSILINCLENFYTDRFQTATELINELEGAIALCQCPYIISSIGSSIDCFTGRETELQHIENHFFKKTGICIVFGPGGTGKTCLAHEYWRRNKHHYNIGVYLDYARGHNPNNIVNMESLLSSVELRNFDDDPHSETYEKKRTKKIRELLNKKNILILLDNFDMPNDPVRSKAYKAIFKDLQDNFPNADIIITTRTDLKGMSDGLLSGNTTQINIGGLPFEQSFTLFAQNCERDVKGQEESYRRLYDFENGNTLALHILSRLYHKDTHRYNAIEDIYQRLCQGQTLGGIKIYREEKAGEALCHIFDVAELLEEDQNILSIVYLFRRTNLNNEMIYKMYGDDDGDEIINKLNDLVVAGWVTKSNESFFIHPLVKYAVKEKIKPTIEQFPQLQPYEFYMFFSFVPRYQLSLNNDGVNRPVYKLESHFEIADEPLESLHFPEETPLLSNMFFSPFNCLIQAQEQGKLGSNISIDPLNPYYESQYNCIYTKERDGILGHKESSKLLFMGIVESQIPEDKNITQIIRGSCSCNRNHKIIVPKSVEWIESFAFSLANCSEICFHSKIKAIESNTFYGVSSTTKVIFDSLPEKMSTNAFSHTQAEIVFNGCKVERKDNCIINSSDSSLLLLLDSECHSSVKMDTPLLIPHGVKRILNKFCVAGSVVVLPHDIEYIAPGALNKMTEVQMDGQGEHYVVVGDHLVEKKPDGYGTIVHSWSNILPTDDWITTIGSESQTALTEIIIPPNIRFIEYKAFRNAACHSVVLPTSIVSIGNYAFSNRRIETVSFEGSIKQWESVTKNDKCLPFGMQIICNDGLWFNSAKMRSVHKRKGE